MIAIAKASGEMVPFDKEKLRRSLKRVRADKEMRDEIVKTIEGLVVEGMTTRKIYRIAHSLLKRKSRIAAGRFHLKRAIFKMGTSGFPFEQYVAQLLKHQGMKVSTNRIIAGRCVNHEIDVHARDNNHTIFVECKFHNFQGIKTDLKVSLYVKARFEDLTSSNDRPMSANCSSWLVTNTRFSSDAIKYGRCAGLNLIGWDFPKKKSLKDLIELSGLYPVTCITDLKQSEISQLFSEKIVLCRNIVRQPDILDRLQIPESRKRSIFYQCKQLSLINK